MKNSGFSIPPITQLLNAEQFDRCMTICQRNADQVLRVKILIQELEPIREDLLAKEVCHDFLAYYLSNVFDLAVQSRNN